MSAPLVTTRFVPDSRIAEGVLLVIDEEISARLFEIVWCGPISLIPDYALENGEGRIRRIRVHPNTLERLQAALAARGEGEPCPHREFQAIETEHEIQRTCVDCGYIAARSSRNKTVWRCDHEKLAPYVHDWRNGYACLNCGELFSKTYVDNTETMRRRVVGSR